MRPAVFVVGGGGMIWLLLWFCERLLSMGCAESCGGSVGQWCSAAPKLLGKYEP